MRRLFSAPGKVLSTTSALGLGGLAVFGLSFAASVATGYERIWGLPAVPWRAAWRRAVWLAVLTGYLFVEAQSGTVLGGGGLSTALRIAFTLTCGVLFFWWGQRFLLGNRVPARPALTGAVCTMAGLVGLRVFSVLVLSPLTLTSAVTYGPVGTVLMVQSWLIGVGFVIFGGALLGRHLHPRVVPAGAEPPPGTPGAADGGHREPVVTAARRIRSRSNPSNRPSTPERGPRGYACRSGRPEPGPKQPPP